MYINPTFIEDVLSVIQESDPEATMRTSYSGRGMFGTECIGFVTSTPNLVQYAITLVAERSDVWVDSKEFALTAKQDDMGLSTIVYFPSIYVDRFAA